MAEIINGHKRKPRRMFTDEEKTEICQRVAGGQSFRSIAHDYGVGRGVISSIARKGGV